MNYMTPTSIEDIDLSAMDFPVELQEIFTKIPNSHPSWSPLSGVQTYTAVSRDRAQAVVRTDTNEVLGVHGGRYAIRSYSDNAGRMIEALKESDIDVTGATGKVQVFEGGRKLKAEIILPNEIIEPAIGDITQLRFRLYDSYDGSYASQNVLEGMRLWCLNGCTSPDFSLKSYQKHTKQINSSDAEMSKTLTKMNTALIAFHEREAEFRRWCDTSVQRVAVQDMFERTLAHAPTRTKPNAVSEPSLNALMKNFDDEPRTVWGAYNAATAWSSHPDTKGKVYNVERTRETKVASMLRDKHWLELEGANNEVMIAS